VHVGNRKCVCVSQCNRMTRYMHVCVRVCVCVCERERERERVRVLWRELKVYHQSKREKEWGWEGKISM